MPVKSEFVPVLLGNDINSYSMARAFHEEYKIKSIIIGKLRSGPNNHSKISNFIVVKNLETNDIFLKTVRNIALENKENNLKNNTDKKLLLIACGDSYVSLIIKNKSELKRDFIIPYIDEALMNDLINKEKFYQICQKHGIDYPKTFIYRKNSNKNTDGKESVAKTSENPLQNYDLGFDFPVILKPSNGIEYWEYPFEGQDKVFKLKDKKELEQTINKIYDSGYSDSLIIQDFIPGDDSFMRVLTCYSDKNGKVRLMSLGHVILEEHTPHGLGNHAAIINDYNEPLMNKIKTFLEQIHFVGFSNFDIKYDMRDNKYKVFEINLRQGRSNFYVTGVLREYNLAKYVVEDYIQSRESSTAQSSISSSSFSETAVNIVKEKKLWLVIPQSIALKYTVSKELKNEIKSLIKQRRVINPLFYKGDYNIKRLLYLVKSHLSHFAKYKKYYR